MRYCLLTLHSAAKSKHATNDFSDYICRGDNPADQFLEIKELCKDLSAHHAPTLINVLKITQAQALKLNPDVDYDDDNQ